METLTRKNPFTFVQYVFLPSLILLMLFQPANAAEVTATLQGTFPVVASPGATVPQAFWIQVDVAGSAPSRPRNPSVIVVCTQDTLLPDGTITCDVQRTINLAPGHNYTQSKTDTLGNTFPILIPKTVVVDPGVECGRVYQVAESLFSNPGSGVDMGENDTRLDLPFSIQVECATLGCTLTQGFWKTHEEAWPVDSLKLGNRTYSKSELLTFSSCSGPRPLAGRNGSGEK